ncbi:hypothetical protein CDCA_CDCA04G1334 [Cyanidium caldarium]|uniref:CAF17 C-terminal domain-containing protein n=1 Tax=Cyanidium caldarium TaxID=2771 RepID=A0AAV9IT28_CYACA|nr:hypothetical protein CDCA_CDCA04G1334 [Cyanidium caldarium]
MAPAGRRLCLHRWTQFLARLSTPRRPRRALLSVVGSDTMPFIHGLCTADVQSHAAQTPKCLASCFLDRRGRVLFDALLYLRSPEEMWIEVDNRVAAVAREHLQRYRLRARVALGALERSHELYVQVPGNIQHAAEWQADALPQAVHTMDPRWPPLGRRLWLPGTATISHRPPHHSPLASSSVYQLYRILQAVPEGVEDVPAHEALPLECNFERLQAIAFHKGCYLGQELTARTHHVGVVRKRLVSGVLARSAAEAMQRAAAAEQFVAAAEEEVEVGLPHGMKSVFPDEAVIDYRAEQWLQGYALTQADLQDVGASHEPVDATAAASAADGSRIGVRTASTTAAARSRRPVGSLRSRAWNVALALVRLADADLRADLPLEARLLQVDTPAATSPLYFCWWIPPYLRQPK